MKTAIVTLLLILITIYAINIYLKKSKSTFPTYSAIATIVSCLVLMYFFGSILAASNALLPPQAFTALYGKPSLQISSPTISLTMKRDTIQKVKFTFDRQLREKKSRKEEVIDNDISQALLSHEIEARHISDGSVWILQTFEDPYTHGIMAPIKIIEVAIDGTKITLDEFLDHLDREKPKLVYPYQITELSHQAATYLGHTLSYVILAILITLTTSQAILFGITLKQDIAPLRDFLDDQKSSTSIFNFFDNLASNYAIPLGFLGTVTSIWLSLEASNINFNNFGSFLYILKIAIFNSVLGLSAKMLCVLRVLSLRK